ncbi:putative adenylyl-sulfate kinase [Dirofilaria immitis]
MKELSICQSSRCPGQIMVKRDGRGHSYRYVRGEILGP